MRNPFWYIAVLILLFSSNKVRSQQSGIDTISVLSGELPMVELTSGRMLLNDQSKLIFDSTELSRGENRNVADLLDRQSGVFVKSYGLGSLATLSLRGSSAGQVAVLWNGLPIENSMLGLLDVSLLDPFYFDAIEVSAGGQSSGFGSGAVAGTVHLSSNDIEESEGHLAMSLRAGSFGATAQHIHSYFVSQNKQWSFRTKVINRSADNDFQYFDLREDGWKRQLNARLEQRGFQQEVFYRPNEQEQFSFRVWGQQSEKELPATTRQRRAESSQGDDFLRTSFHYRNQGEKSLFQLRSGLFRETIDFRDPNNDLRSVSHLWKALLAGENDWYLRNNWRLTVGLSTQWLEGETDAYNRPRQQFRWSPFAAIRKKIGRLTTKLSMRQQLVDNQVLPITPSLELQWKVNDWLATTASASRTYRLPSLNDLFWNPGGRPDLAAEQGWSQQLSISAMRKQRLSWKTALSAHHRLINNWIQWAPLAGDIFWSANNLTKVRSYGLESNTELGYQAGKYRFRFHLAAEYVRSENLIAIELPRLLKGQQLAYVPEWSGRASLSVVNKRTSLRYQHQYVGSRRGNSDDEIAAYDLGRIIFQHQVTLKDKYRLQFNTSLENCWNREYRVIENRRMPGRYLQSGLRLSI